MWDEYDYQDHTRTSTASVVNSFSEDNLSLLFRPLANIMRFLPFYLNALFFTAVVSAFPSTAGDLPSPALYTCPSETEGLVTLVGCRPTENCVPSLVYAEERCAAMGWSRIVTRRAQAPKPFGYVGGGRIMGSGQYSRVIWELTFWFRVIMRLCAIV